MNTDC